MLAPYEDQITSRDVTPDDFGRIAAQTAKQVDPAADPRGRAAHDVRGVPGPRRRADHRDHPAVRQPLHAGPAARARRGAAAALRAGYSERYDHGMRDQGRDHRRLRRGQGPEHRRLPAQPRADQEAVRARGARDRRRPRRDRRASPASPASARRSPSSRMPTASTRSAPASAPAARACGWSSPSCAARRSTSSLTTRSPPASSRRRSAPARVREVLVDDETSRRR